MKNYGKIDEGKDLVDRDYADGKAPKVHSSPTSEYGAATGQKFGHVMLVDQITNIGASAGRAASPYSVKLAYDKAEAATSKVVRVMIGGTPNATMPDFDNNGELFLYAFNVDWVTAETQFSDIQLASEYVGNPEAELVASAWDYLETYNGNIHFYFRSVDLKAIGISLPLPSFELILREVN